MAAKVPLKHVKKKLEADTEDPKLAFLSVLPDCPHVSKSMKAAFSNWWLRCKRERINLALIRTLRNHANKETKDTSSNLIPQNNHIKNKDTQHSRSVLTLSSTELTSEFKCVSYVCLTIIYATTRVWSICIYFYRCHVNRF